MRNFYWVLSLLVLSATGCGQEEPVPAAVADSPVEESEKVAAPAKAEQKAAVATQHRPLSRADITEGWIQLFDGESLFGWKATNDVNWER